MTRQLTTMFAAGLYCALHGNQPVAAFTGIGIWLILFISWANFTGSEQKPLTFPDILGCSKEQYRVLFQTGSMPVDQLKKRSGSNQALEAVYAAIIVITAATGLWYLMAPALVIYSFPLKSLRGTGGWVMPIIYVLTIATATYIYHPAAALFAGTLIMKEEK